MTEVLGLPSTASFSSETTGNVARLPCGSAEAAPLAPNQHAQSLLLRVLGCTGQELTGVGQADVEAFFSATVLTAVQTAYTLLNKARAGHVQPPDVMARAIRSRQEELWLRVEGTGKTDEEVGALVRRGAGTVKANIVSTVGLLRKPDLEQGVGPDCLRGAFARDYPNAQVAPKPKPVTLERQPSKRRVASVVNIAGESALAAVSKAPPRSRTTVHPKPSSALNGENGSKAGPDSGLDPVAVYLNGIGKVPLLSAEQEVDLAKRIEAGLYAVYKLETQTALSELERLDLKMVVHDGSRARNQLLTANLRFVVSLAKRYTGRGLPLLDLIQEGNLGLIRAVEKFDYTKGYKFSTYAAWWIRQAIERGLAWTGDTIRKPADVVEDIRSLQGTRGAIVKKLGRVPTEAELVAETGFDASTVRRLLYLSLKPVSLDKPISDDDARLGDYVADDAPDPASAATKAIETRLLQRDIAGCLGDLNDQERQALLMHHGFMGREYTPSEIAAKLGLKTYEMSLFIQRALNTIRASEHAERLRQYA